MIPNGQKSQLNTGMEIYQEKFFRVSKANFDFYEIAKWIEKKNGHDRWILNYNFKTNVPACPVSAKLKDIFGEDFLNIKIPHLPKENSKREKEFLILSKIFGIFLFSSFLMMMTS